MPLIGVFMKHMWAVLQFPPINLWNFPKQYRDVSEKEVEEWYKVWEEFNDKEYNCEEG